MFNINWTVPLVLSLAMVWVSWRVVNWPIFADFLIATEAEMNKVSWTSRARLIQDTIVVLVTVILLTVFLFVVDLLWIRVLGLVDVLQVDVRAVQQRQQEKSQW
jgi:preprotein translocase subunit SecE